MRYSEKWPQYAKWWDAMKSLPGRQKEFDDFAHVALTHKDVYSRIEQLTGVPWPFIALTHKRENGPDFDHSRFAAYLGNGQPLSRKTTIVPKNRGPFLGPNAFVNGAVDALRIEGMSSINDWRLEKILYWCEVFNGSGYSAKGLPSPYVWGGTNIQRPGKYVADHVFNAKVWDPQPGCAPMLKAIETLDPTVHFIRES